MIFVLLNDKPAPAPFNHDNDFMNDMHTKVVSGISTLASSHASHSSHKCVAEFRNTGRVTKVLVKYLHKILHVYLDLQDGLGYKFCLAVQLDKSYKDYHIAFTAATGQVADNHDILEIVTRYLSESDKDTDDALLPHLGTSISRASWSSFYWVVLILVGVGLCIWQVYEIYLYSQLKQIDAVRICERINSKIMQHYVVHLLLTLSLIFFGTWWALLLNLPVALYRIYLISTSTYRLNHSLAPQQTHAPFLYGILAFYVVALLYYFIHTTSM